MRDKDLPLTEVVESVREQLTELMRESADKELLFEVGHVELSLGVEVSRSAGASGKAKFWVVEAGVDGTVGRKATHTVKVRLEPKVTASGERVMVADEGREFTPRPSGE
jgi:hypothetical protein